MSINSSAGVSTEQPGTFLSLVGTASVALKQWWILSGLTFGGAVIALMAPLFLADDDGKLNPVWTPWVVALGIAAALAVVLDRVADYYDRRMSAIALQGSEDTAENAVSDLNTFISECLELSFLEGSARDKMLLTLKRILTMCAAKAIGPGSRATYYTLRYAADGTRILGQPQHTCEYGRYDKPKRPFIEAENSEHPVWRLMDGPDEEPEVRNHGEVIGDLDWEKKKYRTFLSIPVKINEVQFGMLSVNCSKDGAIGGSQRAAMLAMARSMALVLAMVRGPRLMTGRAASEAVSVASDTLTATENGEPE